MEKLFITVKEFIQLSGLPPGKAYDFVRSDKTPKLKMGKRYFLNRQAVIEMLNDPERLAELNSDLAGEERHAGKRDA